MEEWRPFVDYPKYEVSNLGQVRRGERILKSGLNIHGYHYVNLCKNGIQTQKRINRLVALAFLPNIENKPFVDHIDRNKTNNVVTNLRWATISENGLNSKSRDRSSFGITWNKRSQKYQVQITIQENKRKTFGYYATLEEAIRVRDETLQRL